jgi:hypothetical protein
VLLEGKCTKAVGDVDDENDEPTDREDFQFEFDFVGILQVPCQPDYKQVRASKNNNNKKNLKKVRSAHYPKY